MPMGHIGPSGPSRVIFFGVAHGHGPTGMRTCFGWGGEVSFLGPNKLTLGPADLCMFLDHRNIGFDKNETLAKDFKNDHLKSNFNVKPTS